MGVSITESGVTFGPFPEDRLYYIEKSDSFINYGNGLSTVEFVYKNAKNQICFVEAKSSAPNPANPENAPDCIEVWMHDIVKKFCDSLQLFLAVYLKRCEEPKMGSEISAVDIHAVPIKFILVMTPFQSEWLQPVQDELNKQLHGVTKRWNAAVAVMNAELAKEYGMIA